jgi:hypothetical protein
MAEVLLNPFVSLAFKVQSSKFKVQGSRFKVQGSRFKVQGSKFKVIQPQGNRGRRIFSRTALKEDLSS